MHPCHELNRTTFSGYASCQRVHQNQDYMSITDTLRNLTKTNREIFDDCQDILNR